MSDDLYLISPDDINEELPGIQHILYVEGNERSIDYIAIHNLLDLEITVRGLGARSNVVSVAEALHKDHPQYYFLVDRDAHSDGTVSESWRNFPDPTKNNLLIWTRKEIENYFIDPDWVQYSRFFVGDIGEYIERLQQEATKRVYFEAANRVIIEVREKVKEKWISCFDYDETSFQSAETVRGRLCGLPEFRSKMENDRGVLSEEHIRALFDTELLNLLGGEESCVHGTGKWLELMSGKELLKIMLHNTSFFRVVGQNRRVLQGRQKEEAFVRTLVRLQNEHLPEDFRNLKALIHRVMEDETLHL